MAGCACIVFVSGLIQNVLTESKVTNDLVYNIHNVCCAKCNTFLHISGYFMHLLHTQVMRNCGVIVTS